jgi:hypothetical protein
MTEAELQAEELKKETEKYKTNHGIMDRNPLTCSLS